jgi:hypothetical protein
MKMQNLEFTMIYIPGKENVTDYMSRHALSDSERTGVEKHARAVTQAGHAVVLEKIATETEQDAEHAMQTGVWDKKDPTVEVDFCGPLPNGRYALVVTDQYSRYLEVKFTTTTLFEATRKKLKKIFATHGVPQNLQSEQRTAV